MIITPPDNPLLATFETGLRRVFGEAFRSIAPGQYVAAKDHSTSEDIQRALGPSGEVGRFIVMLNGGWSGWHQNEHWEWLRVHGA